MSPTIKVGQLLDTAMSILVVFSVSVFAGGTVILRKLYNCAERIGGEMLKCNAMSKPVPYMALVEAEFNDLALPLVYVEIKTNHELIITTNYIKYSTS